MFNLKSHKEGRTKTSTSTKDLTHLSPVAQLPKRLVRQLLKTLGYQITRVDRSTCDTNAEPRSAETAIPAGTVVSVNADGKRTWMLSSKYVRYLRTEMTQIARGFVQPLLLPEVHVTEDSIASYVEEFLLIYPDRPVKDNTYGCQFSNLFWLYVTCRCLNPNLVVESGVWKGQSSWVLRRAAPAAQMECFDISLAPLVYKGETIQYHEADWRRFSFSGADPQASLVFFDDHVNQARRVREAYEKGFRYLIFDDNLPAYQIHKDLPCIMPTIDMLNDPNVASGDEFTWIHDDKVITKIYQPGSDYDARDIIERWANFPLVDAESSSSHARLGGRSDLAFVVLRRHGI